MSLTSKIYQKLPKSVKIKTVNLYRYLPTSKKTVVKEIDGIIYELDLSRLVHAQMYYYGVWEPYTTAIMNKYIKPGMVCFDIGASSGVHTLRMAKLIDKRGMIYAFEPSDWMFEKLTTNVELNVPTIVDHSVMREKIALSDENKWGMIESTEHGKVGRAIDEPEIKVSFMTIDKYVKVGGIKRLDFIKVDTDGFEVKIFQGGKKTIERFHPVMVVEFRPSLCLGLIEILSSLGYQFYREDTFEQYTEKELIQDINKEVRNVLCR